MFTHSDKRSRLGQAVKNNNVRLVSSVQDLGSIPLRLSPLLRSGGMWTLSCEFVPHNKSNIKMALISTHLNSGVILVV